jgi:PhnB protein
METQTVTACPFVQDVPALVTFLGHAFGATEKLRGRGASGGYHAELQIGSSELMIGGGPDLGWKGDVRPMAFHMYVADADATYKRAMESGAESLQPPTDLGRGRRTANIKDPSGNRWYIASAGDGDKLSFGSPIINPYIHSLNSEPVIAFLRKVFGAVDYGRVATVGGGTVHATLFIGKSCIEIGGASGIYQPMPGMFYVCLADANAVAAVAASIGLIGYGGDRFAFKDAWGNTWYVYTRPAK